MIWCYILFLAGCLPILILLFYVLFVLYFGKSVKSKVEKTGYTEPVSIIISCFNEEQFIEQRIQDLLRFDNWIEGSEIIIVSGGSVDRTNDIINKYASDQRIRSFVFEERISKIEGVNYAVEQSRHKLLVFSDCRQLIEPGSVPLLIHHFSDDEIGLVTSTLVDTKNSSQPSLTRSLLNKLAIKLSEKSSGLNVFGALYAQRKDCFKTIPNDILFDDLFVTVSILKQGKRLVQDPNAIIYDVHFNDYYQKDRIMRLARGLLLFFSNHFKLIWSIPLGKRLEFLVFKYLKLVLPFSLMILAAALIILIFKSHFLLPIICAGLLLIFLILPTIRRMMFQFTYIQWCFGIAIFQFLMGRDRSTMWNKLK